MCVVEMGVRGPDPPAAAETLPCQAGFGTPCWLVSRV